MKFLNFMNFYKTCMPMIKKQQKYIFSKGGGMGTSYVDQIATCMKDFKNIDNMPFFCKFFSSDRLSK